VTGKPSPETRSPLTAPPPRHPAFGRLLAFAPLGLALGLAGCGPSDPVVPPALAELHRRATGGDPDSQLELGMRYATGKGIPPDERAARRWIGQAAGQGNAAAQFELGSYYTLEPQRDYERAADLLRKSALQGFAPAQTSLAMLYLAGAGVSEDRVEAYAWLLLASAQGERDAVGLEADLRRQLDDGELAKARELARQRGGKPL
jgi:TPR repeat protein